MDAQAMMEAAALTQSVQNARATLVGALSGVEAEEQVSAIEQYITLRMSEQEHRVGGTFQTLFTRADESVRQLQHEMLASEQLHIQQLQKLSADEQRVSSIVTSLNDAFADVEKKHYVLKREAVTTLEQEKTRVDAMYQDLVAELKKQFAEDRSASETQHKKVQAQMLVAQQL